MSGKSTKSLCGGGWWWWVLVGKPNLVKDFCPRLPLDLDLDFGLGLGQAFQKIKREEIKTYENKTKTFKQELEQGVLKMLVIKVYNFFAGMKDFQLEKKGFVHFPYTALLTAIHRLTFPAP